MKFYLEHRLRIILSEKYGSLGYVDSDCYNENFNISEFLKYIHTNTIDKSSEVFIKNYQKKYSEENYYPIWMLVEAISLGQLYKLYKGLSRTYQNAIEKNLNISFNVLASWMHSISYIRNLCAHHSRLWNRRLAIKPKVLKNNKIWSDIDSNNQKLFSILLVVKELFKEYWAEQSQIAIKVFK